MDNGEQSGEAVTAAMFQTIQETMKDHQQELLSMDEETTEQFQQLAKKMIKQVEKG